MSRWPTVKLAELTTKVGSGSTPRGGSEAYKSEGTPLIRSMNVHFDGVRDEGLAFIDATQARALDGVTVRGGDVLLNITGASIGRVAVAPERFDGARVNQHVCIIRTRDPLDAQFLKLFLNAPAQQNFIMAEEAGATRQALTKEKILNFDIPLPPLNEQRRIVAKLEALQARSRRAREALEAVPPLLEKLRQSILAAAFRGDLTKDWRAKHKNVEPASELLKRIRAERKKKWEEAELAKMKAKGKPPTDDKWKAKYKEPAPVDATGLPELPEEWCWGSLDELTFIVGGVTKGQKRKGTETLRHVPYLRVANVQRGHLNLDEVKTIEATEEEVADLRLRPGDVLLNEGGDRDKLGRGWVWEGQLAECIHQNHVFRARPVVGDLQSKYVSHYANHLGQSFFIDQGKQTTNLASVSMSRIRRFPIALPPATEQSAIIDLLDDRLARASSLEVAVNTIADQATTLDRATLSKAFSGGLVPQDPNDEPAQAMLARVPGANGPGANGSGTNGKRTTVAKRGRRPGARTEEVT